MNGAGLHQVLTQLRIDRVREKIKAPHIRKQAGRNAKRNHVRQRIELSAEIARRICHPRDPSIERIKGNGYQNGDRCKVQMRQRPISHCVAADGCDGLRDCKITSSDIQRREERRQDKHSAPQTCSVPCLG